MVADGSMDLARVRTQEVATGQGAATGWNKWERQEESIGAHIAIVIVALSVIDGGFVA